MDQIGVGEREKIHGDAAVQIGIRINIEVADVGEPKAIKIDRNQVRLKRQFERMPGVGYHCCIQMDGRNGLNVIGNIVTISVPGLKFHDPNVVGAAV